MQTLLAIFLMVGIVGSAEAQRLYRYVDEKGEVHMTDDPNTIPKAKNGKGGAPADPRQPPRQLQNENFIYTLPPGFKMDLRRDEGTSRLPNRFRAARASATGPRW